MNARRAILLTPLIALAFLIGCGPDLEQMKDDAQHALSVGNFSQSREISTRALERLPKSEKRLAWSLERIRLEALARDGMAGEALETLERLAREYPGQANGSLYLAIASYVKDAGDSSGAIDILIAGDKRFPEDSGKFEAQIRELHEAGSMDPAEIERLKSLGYL
jgi:tetratricopeptide (TPR) repeat protein